jgi:hypothetical protein
MQRTTAVLAALLFCVVGPAYAVYSVGERGEWPKSWPGKLEPLRNQSRTLVGPVGLDRYYAIRFTKRAEFESAWPQLLKVKSKGAPVFLVRAPNFFLGDHGKAGVVVHCPPLGQADNPATPEAPIAGVTNPGERWMNTTYIELVVDDDIVNVKRIKLPKGVPIIDQRDQSKEKQQ